MEPKVYVTIAVDGKVTRRRRVCKSFVKAYSYIVYVQMSGTAQNLTDTGGTLRSVPATSNNLLSSSAADTSTRGIVVGTGTNPVDITDTKLQTQIATGNGAGQLRYMAQTFNGPFTESTKTKLQLIRSFVNNSGSTITVNEVGLYLSGGTTFDFCGIRDTIEGGQGVNAGQTLTVTYTIEFPV